MDKKKLITNLLLSFSGGENLLRTWTQFKEYLSLSNFQNKEELFTSYYKNNVWRRDETISGAGSTIKYTENIRKEIPKVIKLFNIGIILDAPCGDYNWFRTIPRDERTLYIGGDIVEPLILKNRELYEKENTRFIKIDITEDRLPKADLWLCRDCLFHFSDEDIFKTINNFLESDINYLLTSSHIECRKNRNIRTGSFRLLNLELPPFSFNKPLFAIDDWTEGHPPRQLLLWEKKTISDAFNFNTALKRTI